MAIENTYSCAIIDKDLFGLLSDEEGFSKFRELLAESVKMNPVDGLSAFVTK